MLLRFHLPANVLDNLELNVPTPISDDGYLHISFYSEYGYEVPPEGVTGYHSLFSFTTSDNLMVTKTNDGWIIEFNQPLEELTEMYTMEYEYQLNARKTKIGTKSVHPLTVDTNPLNFTMIWERIQ